MKKNIKKFITLFLYSAGKVQHLLLLSIRLYMANIFWKSGILKISNWDNTMVLFEYEHPVPFLPTIVAAVSGTLFELLCPILLVIGIGTRFAAIPLLVMTAVIQFTYMDHITHYYWAFLLSTIICVGPGAISADYFVKKKWGKSIK